MPTFKIFYSWQSDLPGNKTRNFIRNCIDDAGNHHAADQYGKDNFIVGSIVAGNGITGHSTQNNGQAKGAECDDA